MKRQVTLSMMLLLCTTVAWCQSLSAEFMAGDKNYWHQYSGSVRFGQSKFGLFFTSSQHLLYEESAKNEVMSQLYATYPLNSFLTIAAGTFYATKPGISPSLSAQFRFKNNNLRGIIAPRVDVKNRGSVEIMSSVEYTPPITPLIGFYSRLQLMSNYGPYHHNRSYQNIRMGLQVKHATFGFALNVDERGAEKATMHNWGGFVRLVI